MYIYIYILDQACFALHAAYAKSKDSVRIQISLIFKYDDGYQRGLLSMVNKFFITKQDQEKM